MEGSIKITGVDPAKFINAVYDLSSPVGMGRLHFQAGALPAKSLNGLVAAFNTRLDQIKKIISHDHSFGANSILFPVYVLSLDYVLGRACKMSVRADENGDLWIDDNWFDHSRGQLLALCAACSIKLDGE